MKLNEDFTNLYKRWCSGKRRKEDGTEVETVFGKVLLKNPNCDVEWLFDYLLNLDNSDVSYIYSIQNMSYTQKEYDDISNFKSQYDYPIEKLRHGGRCIQYKKYEESIEDGDFTDDDYCKDDYIEIIRCLSKYLYENIDIDAVKGKTGEYAIVLYSDVIDDDINLDFIGDDFYDDFNYELKYWSYQYETNIGVDITYNNVKRYKEMKEYIKDYIENNK